MDVEIGTNLYALDDLNQKAEQFIKQQSIDKAELMRDFREAYNAFRGNKALIYVNVLQGMSKQLAERAQSEAMNPLIVEVVNNLYLALAAIEWVDAEAQIQSMVDGDPND